jgi:hypothetical protein
VSDIDTGVVDSLKALDPDGRLEKRKSIREVAMSRKCQERLFRALPKGDSLDHLRLTDVRIAPVRNLISAKMLGLTAGPF